MRLELSPDDFTKFDTHDYPKRSLHQWIEHVFGYDDDTVDHAYSVALDYFGRQRTDAEAATDHYFSLSMICEKPETTTAQMAECWRVVCDAVNAHCDNHCEIIH